MNLSIFLFISLFSFTFGFSRTPFSIIANKLPNELGAFKSKYVTNLVISITTGLVFNSFPAFAGDLVPAPWNNGIQYEVLKSAPSGAGQPKVGDLVAIRFRGDYKGNTFDDTFKTDQPYFYRF